MTTTILILNQLFYWNRQRKMPRQKRSTSNPASSLPALFISRNNCYVVCRFLVFSVFFCFGFHNLHYCRFIHLPVSAVWWSLFNYPYMPMMRLHGVISMIIWVYFFQHVIRCTLGAIYEKVELLNYCNKCVVICCLYGVNSFRKCENSLGTPPLCRNFV